VIDYDRIRSFYEQHRTERASDPNITPDTAKPISPGVRLRNVAAAEHLDRVLKIEAGQRVLSVSADSEHWSRFFAQRGAHVTALDRGARAPEAQIEQRAGTILDPPLSAAERFDIVFLADVLVQLEAAALEQVRGVVRAHCKAGALLLLHEAVERPELYRQLFAPDFRLLYECPAMSRVAAWQQYRALPLLAHVDYYILRLEQRWRLAAPGVRQRFYIFVRKR
jgi:hypothetical protein